MTVETATYLSQLDASYPADGGKVYEGDNHIRLIKTTILASLANISGACTATHTELNLLAGVAAGTVSASKALVCGATKNLDALVVTTFTATTATVTTLNATTIAAPQVTDLQMNDQAFFDALVDNGTVTAGFDVDWTDGNCQKVTLGGDSLAMTFTDPSGPAKLTLIIKQDATGTRLKGTWPTILSRGGEGSSWALSTAANSIDILHLFFDGTSYYGQLSQGWA